MLNNFKINNINLLTEDECLEVHSVVYELKKFWQCGDKFHSFFTLGTSAYMDLYHYGFSSYCAKANLFNPILFKHFRRLYQKLSETLTRELGEPVCYQQKFALPGFNIFTVSKYNLSQNFVNDHSPEEHRRLAHIDKQYEMLNWEFLGEDSSCKSMTFTVVIALPKSGGGLDVWDLSSEEIVGLSDTEVRQILCSREKMYFPYQVGQLVLHSGLFYHQIAPKPLIQPEDERMTLQGHGLFRQGIWHLYW